MTLLVLDERSHVDRNRSQNVLATIMFSLAHGHLVCISSVPDFLAGPQSLQGDWVGDGSLTSWGRSREIEHERTVSLDLCGMCRLPFRCTEFLHRRSDILPKQAILDMEASKMKVLFLSLMSITQVVMLGSPKRQVSSPPELFNIL